MPDFTSQSATPSVVFFAGAKVLAIFSADQCLPVFDKCIRLHKKMLFEGISYQNWESLDPKHQGCTPRPCVSCFGRGRSWREVSHQYVRVSVSSTDAVLRHVSRGAQSCDCQLSVQQSRRRSRRLRPQGLRSAFCSVLELFSGIWTVLYRMKDPSGFWPSHSAPYILRWLLLNCYLSEVPSSIGRCLHVIIYDSCGKLLSASDHEACDLSQPISNLSDYLFPGILIEYGVSPTP